MKISILILTLLFSPTMALAHHAFSKDFLADEIETVDGEIVEVFYQNPHARYYIQADDGQGGKTIWDGQTQNLSMLTRLGWKKDTFQVGDKVKVTGNLGRNGTKRLWILSVENQAGEVRRPVWVTDRSRGSTGSEQAGATSGVAEPAEVKVSGTRPVEDYLGSWRITSPLLLASVPGIKTYYDITIQREGEGLTGWAYNGPFAVKFEDSQIVMTIDWTEGSDAQNESTFTGFIDNNGDLVGDIDHGGHVYFTGNPAINGVFSGARIDYPESESVSRLNDQPPEPEDFSGLWSGDSSKIGLNKTWFDLTETGRKITASFEPEDAPQIRCAGYGLVNTFVFSNIIYDVEILQNDDQLTILYGADYVRRIYMDGREFPENRQNTYMGFSRGEWKGDTLVVKTTNIAPSFLRTGHGHPISENAYTVEHYSLSDDGQLRAEMWVFDQGNYNRPPYFRAIFSKNPAPVVITKHGCDPKSFFRQLHAEGELDEFFSRSAAFHR